MRILANTSVGVILFLNLSLQYSRGPDFLQEILWPLFQFGQSVDFRVNIVLLFFCPFGEVHEATTSGLLLVRTKAMIMMLVPSKCYDSII